MREVQHQWCPAHTHLWFLAPEDVQVHVRGCTEEVLGWDQGLKLIPAGGCGGAEVDHGPPGVGGGQGGGGEYLPLGVYKTRGFDVDAITAHCQDRHEHPVLGTCYRVRIRGVYCGTYEAMVREELHQAKTQRVGSPAPPPDVPAPPPAVDAKTLAKEAAKQTRATKALAKKVVARIGPVVVSLEAAFNRTELLAHVPTFAVTPAKASLGTLRNYYGAAKDAHTSENPRPLHFESQVVEEAAKAGTTNYQLLSQMLNTAEKHIKG